MSILERDVERRSCSYVTTCGGLTVKIQGARGWPDRLVMRRDGSMFLVEFKRPGAKPTMMQEHVIGQLRKRRIKAYVISSLRRFVEVYDERF